jgi:hypothetical protein
VRSLGYNNRLQVNSIVDALASNHAVQLLNLAPAWGGANNNGTLQGITQNNGGPGYPQLLTFKDSFTYDGVNRLKTVTGKDGSNNMLWSQTYDYL